LCGFWGVGSASMLQVGVVVLIAGRLWVFRGRTGCGWSTEWVTGWTSGVDLGDEICSKLCISFTNRWRLPDSVRSAPFKSCMSASKVWIRSSFVAMGGDAGLLGGEWWNGYDTKLIGTHD
jgi:hypothetical protein